MRKTLLYLGVSTMAFITACKKDLTSNDVQLADEQSTMKLVENPGQEIAGEGFEANELLVKFKKGTTEKGRANALSRVAGNVKELILTKAMRRLGDEEGVFLIHTPLAVFDAIKSIKGNADVVFAEPNYVYTYGSTSNDTYYTNGSLWGMYGDATSPSNQYGSQAGEAWAAGHTGSSTVIVGIIDEGIQTTHPDLDANIWKNPFDAADGIDNDGNGYVDDVNGWDFDGNNSSVYDGGTRGNLDKHGTHVAGTIGGEGGNGTGVAGVNWNVKMISCKFLGRNGGTTANAIKAVDYLTDLKTRHGIDLVASNNSWGGGGYSQALHDAIIRAAKANILFIAAAGNGGSDGVGDNNDVTATYPSNYSTSTGTSTQTAATYDGVIAVAALASSGAKASYSNYGATTVDLGAPGSGVYSTLPPNTYGSYSGTSMATPHVTGGAALRAAYSADRGSVLKTTLLNAASATPTSSLSTITVTKGRLNVSGF